MMKTTSPVANKNDVLNALSDVIIKINDAFANHYSRAFKNLSPPLVTMDGAGRKYMRVSMVGPYQTSAYFFIDLATGDLLKAASYKAPALNFPRGNLFKGDVLTALTPYGVIQDSTNSLQAILDSK